MQHVILIVISSGPKKFEIKIRRNCLGSLDLTLFIKSFLVMLEMTKMNCEIEILWNRSSSQAEAQTFNIWWNISGQTCLQTSRSVRIPIEQKYTHPKVNKRQFRRKETIYRLVFEKLVEPSLKSLHFFWLCKQQF